MSDKPIKEGLQAEALMFADDGETLFNVETGEVISDVMKKKLAHKANIPIATKADNRAVGFVVSRKQPTPTEFLKELKAYQTDPGDIYKQMDVCDKMYKHESTVGTAIDILVEFAITNVLVENLQNEKAEQLITWFNKHLNSKLATKTATFSQGVQAFLQQGALDYLVCGNAFPVKIWKQHPFEGKKVKLPLQIRYLNPQTIEIPAYSNAFGETVLYIRPPSVRSYLQETNSDEILKKIPNEISQFFGDSMKSLPLDTTIVSHLARKKRDYEAWGTSYLLRSIQAVAAKKKLRQLDDATIDGMVNLTTIFKIGSTDAKSPYHEVSRARLMAFKNLLSDPNATNTIVWPHDLEVDTVGPEGTVLNFENKYDEANQEILKALGIPRVLIDGEGKIDANWVSVLALIERLEQIRTMFIRYLEDLYAEILHQNGFENEEPKVRWTRMSLRNEREVKNMILAFYDRGLLPIQTALTEAGYDFKTQMERQKIEIDDDLKSFFPKPAIPFDSPSNNTKPGDSGRPTDTTDDPNSQGRGSMVGRESDNYATAILSVYQDMSTKCKQIVARDWRNDKKVRATLVSGFEDIRSATNASLAIDLQAYGVDTESESLSMALFGWNSSRLAVLQKQVLLSVIHAMKDKDMVQFEGVLTVFQSGLLDILRQGREKAAFVAESLVPMKAKGMIGGTIEACETGGCATCEVCKPYADKWYSLHELVSVWPIHAGCTCIIKLALEKI